MGSRCSKSSTRNVSENSDPEKFKETLEENETNLSKNNTKEQNETLLDEVNNMNNEDNFNENDNELSSFNSRKSTKNTEVDLDLGFTPGVLPFQNTSLSFTDQNSSLTFKDQNSLLFNQTTSELNNSWNESMSQYENLSKESSMVKSMDTYFSAEEAVQENEQTLEMRTFTPFDMKKTDELAQFLISRCGMGLQKDHNPLNCAICQTVDLSDAPLIA